MKRCTLCGGKLNRDKRCTFCGLDNTKNDSMYREMISRNSCENEPLTHVHKEPAGEPVKVKPKVNVPKQTDSAYGTPKYKNMPAQTPKAPAKTKGKKNVGKAVGCSTILTLIPFIIALIGLAGNIFENIAEPVPEPDYFIEEEYGEYDPYGWIIDEMPVEGEEFSAFLEAGIYEVGYHIPMGTYQIELVSEGYGTVEICDSNNAVYVSEFLDRDTDNVTMEDMLLFNGAYLIVMPGTEVSVYTENAQLFFVEGMENEPQDAIYLEGELVVGEDLVPGAYDVYYKSVEDEYVYTEVMIEAETASYAYYMMFDSDVGEAVFHNVPLPEGAVITVEEYQLEGVEELYIVPSASTSNTDLNEFYYNY